MKTERLIEKAPSIILNCSLISTKKSYLGQCFGALKVNFQQPNNLAYYFITMFLGKMRPIDGQCEDTKNFWRCFLREQNKVCSEFKKIQISNAFRS